MNLKSAVAGVVLIVVVVLVAVFKDYESGFSNGNPMDAYFQDLDSLALVEFDPFNSNFDGYQYVDGEAGSVEEGFCGWVGDFIVADIADESQGHEVLVEFTGSCWSGWWSEIYMFAGNTSETVQLGDGIGGEFLVRLDDDNGVVTATRSWADEDPMCCPTRFLVTKHSWVDGEWVEEWSDYWNFEEYDKNSFKTTEEVGVRGSKVLVPEGWVYESVDGGGSGSWSYWRNPNDSFEQVVVITGASFGTWLGLDGVEGSVNPYPNLYADYGPFLEIEKVNDRTFYFDLDLLDGVMSGVWIASLHYDGDCCNAFTEASIYLDEPSEKVVKEFRDYVVSDIN